MLKSKKTDTRSLRTQMALKEALRELILEKYYDDITVQDIIDRAKIGRATFYTHYRDKENLFRTDLQNFLDFVIGNVNLENIYSGQFIPIKELFSHLKIYHSFYRALTKSGKMNRIFGLACGYLEESIQTKFKSFLINETQIQVPLPILANYLANEIFSLLKWWLKHNMPYSPEEMDKFFHSLVTPGITGFIKPD